MKEKQKEGEESSDGDVIKTVQKMMEAKETESKEQSHFVLFVLVSVYMHLCVQACAHIQYMGYMSFMSEHIYL